MGKTTIQQKRNDIIVLKEAVKVFSDEELNMVLNKLPLDAVTSDILDNNMKDKELIEAIVFIAQYVFNNTDVECFISDDKYDMLYEWYREICKGEIVGSINPSDKKKRMHNYPDLRGTLSKVHYVHEADRKKKDTRKSLEQWKKSVMSQVPPHLYDDMDISIYGKWDGTSGIFELDAEHEIDAVLTRGDTEANEAVDISRLFKGRDIKSLIPYFEGHRVGVKTEMVVTKEDFEIINSEYGFKSPRAMVSSISNTDEPNSELLNCVTLVPLRVQNYDTKEIKVINPETMNLKHKTLMKTAHLYNDKLEDIYSLMMDVYRSTCEQYPCDGVVIVLNDSNVCKILGRKDAINKYEIAFKFPAERKTTRLNSVTFSIGLLGNITPVANFDTVVLKGNSVSNASLGSIDRFESMNLAEGDLIDVLYEIIPYVEVNTSSGNELIQTPTHCPVCGQKLQKTPLLSCVNNDCPAIKAGKILNFIGKVKIQYLSIGILGKLIQTGLVNDIADLYTLNKHKSTIVNIEGMGDLICDKIINSIDARKEIPMNILLGSLGIDCAGRKTFEKICKVYKIKTLDDIKKYLLNAEYLIEVPSIKTLTANKIVSGIESNMELITKLMRVINIIDDNKEGVSICFTKVRDKDFEKFLISKGFIVDNNYSSSTNILIVQDEQSESSKITKAYKSNKKILTIANAYKEFGYEKQ